LPYFREFSAQAFDVAKVILFFQNKKIPHHSKENRSEKSKHTDAVAPVFKNLYDSVAASEEAQRSIDSNSQPNYREKLEVELTELRDSEMWQAGATVRSLRPERQV
jgi:ketol-acid reductoisomerase